MTPLKLSLYVGVLLTGLFLVLLIYGQGQQDKELEVLYQQQDNYIDTRSRIDEAISTDRTVDDALERLRARQAATGQ